MPVVEPVDAGVLEVTTEHRADGDVLRKTRHPGAHAADAAHDHVDSRPGRARGVQRVDDVGVLHGVQLQRDATFRTERRLVVHEPDDLPLQLVRRDDELLVLGLAAVPGEIVEQLRGVATDRLFAREEPDVLVDARGDRVVVAGRDVHVAADAARFLAHDEDALRVRLQTDEPVVHVHAGQLQFARPTDVAGLVEACLQLEHDGDLLAGFGGTNEMTGDLAVTRRAVEGHLDRQHFGVAGGLLDERLGRRGERLVRVVHQQLTRADDLEHRLARFGGRGESARGDRSPRREAQFRAVEVRQLRQGRHLDERVVANDVGWFELQFGAHAGEHDLGDVRLHFEANGPAESATAQLHLHGGE